MNPLTHGHLLGGRVAYAQFADGHRSGLEPVLMAALVPARAGHGVVELGTGAGAAMLCLLARVPGARVVGVEIAPPLAALAAANLAANGFSGGLAVAADAAAPPVSRADHAMANPPWHAPLATPSPDAGRRLAHRATAGLAGAWALGLARALKPGGTATLALPAGAFAAWTAALRAAGFGAFVLFPLWPRAGAPAKLLLLQARLGARGADRLAAGLILHEQAGPGKAGFTPAAEAVLRGGAALSFA